MEESKALGFHTILDLYECNKLMLNDAQSLERIMLEAAELAQATIIKSHFHQFSPQGVSGSVIISESHFNIHTWPEFSYAAIDLFTCNSEMSSELAVKFIVEKLESKRHNINLLQRGMDYRAFKK